jgi:predicted DNA-binding transcriptional regulator YafY
VTKLASKLRRVLFLIPYVARHRDGVPLAELAALLNQSPRDLEREVEALLMVGVPQGSPADFVDISIVGRGPSARVFATPSRLLRRPPRLTIPEASALLLGASTLRKTGIPSFDQALERAEAKIRALLKGAATVSDGVVIETGGREHHAVLDTISRANGERRAVELDYASLAAQRRKKITIEPYGLLSHRGAWYVLGRSLTHAENRIFVFKVERILGVIPLDRKFTVPPSFDLRKFANDRLFVAGLSPVEIKLRLRGQAAKRLGSAFRNTRKDRGGALLVRFKECPSGWLAAWVLRQGPDVEVLAPAQLASWVRSLANRVVSAHGERPAAPHAQPKVVAAKT